MILHWLSLSFYSRVSGIALAASLGLGKDSLFITATAGLKLKMMMTEETKLSNLPDDALCNYLDDQSLGRLAGASSQFSTWNQDELHRRYSQIRADIEHYSKLLEINESNDHVRRDALIEMIYFSGCRLRHHIGTIISLLKEKRETWWRARNLALEVLGKFLVFDLTPTEKTSPEALKEHVGAILVCLKDDVWDVAHPESINKSTRLAALETLKNLSPEVLKEYVGEVIPFLKDEKDFVRKAALDVLLGLYREDLDECVGAILPLLEDPTELEHVRKAAREILHQYVSPEVLANAKRDVALYRVPGETQTHG